MKEIFGMKNSINAGYFILTENCNLRCTYCFENGTRDTSKVMSEETAYKAVDFLYDEAVKNGDKEIKITFFGGEPSLHPELMTSIIHYAESICKDTNVRPRYSIITNGTIYNDKIEAFLEEWYKASGTIDIQLSIDGVPEIQNANRPCANACINSSDLIKDAVEGYKNFLASHKINPDCLHIHAVISKESIGRIYDSFLYFTKELGIANSNFAWVIEDDWSDEHLPVFSEQLGLITKRLAQTTTNAKRFPFKRFEKCNGCSAGMRLVAFDTDGNVYPCHRFFFYDAAKRDKVIIGNLYNTGDVITNVAFRQQFVDFDTRKVSDYPSQICMACNYIYSGDMYKMPSDYSIKFMNIINQYYANFSDIIEKKTMLRAIQNLEQRVKQLESKLADGEHECKCKCKHDDESPEHVQE